MSIATGIAKRVTYKVESTWNTVPSAGSAQALRRVKSTLALKKDTYKSNEIRTDYQVADMRHGMKSVAGAIDGELSAGTYKDFMAAATRKAFAAVSPITGASITIAAGSILGGVQSYSVTRAAGSFLTDGVKAGDVIRLSAGSFAAGNLLKNMFVLSVVALVLVVIPLNGVAMVAEGPIATSTVTVIGKKTFCAVTAQTDLSYSIEHWYSDVSLSEVFSGCKVSQMAVQLPPTGMATVSFDFMGASQTTAASQYFTSPTAETTTGILAAVNGVVSAAGVPVGLLTGLSFTLKGNMTAEPVVGSNSYADITEGRMEVEGQFSVLFQDATYRDYFINETEVALAAVLSASPSGTADFIGFSFPRIKVGDAGRDDGEKGLVLTCPFTALLNVSGGASTSSENSTLVVQDSAA